MCILTFFELVLSCDVFSFPGSHSLSTDVFTHAVPGFTKQLELSVEISTVI